MKKVKRSLGKQPALGPLPTELILPFGVIICIGAILWWLQLPVEYVLMLIIALLISAFFILGRNPWKLYDSLISPPRFTRGPRRAKYLV